MPALQLADGLLRVQLLLLQFPPQRVHGGPQLTALFLLLADGPGKTLLRLQRLGLKGEAQLIHGGAQLAVLFPFIGEGSLLAFGRQLLLLFEMLTQRLNRVLELFDLAVQMLVALLELLADLLGSNPCCGRGESRACDRAGGSGWHASEDGRSGSIRPGVAATGEDGSSIRPLHGLLPGFSP